MVTPTATLMFDTFWCYCSNCKMPAAHTEKYHLSSPSFEGFVSKGCGAEFIAALPAFDNTGNLADTERMN